MNRWAKYGLITVFCLGVFTATFVTLELTLGQDHHLDTYSEERFRQRPPPPRYEEKSMSSNELIDLVQNLGPVFVICMAAFWFIKYQSDRMKEMSDEFNRKDTESDNRLFELVERSNEAMMKITASIDSNTKSMDTLITAIGRKGLN